jgi:hypothetical protein
MARFELGRPRLVRCYEALGCGDSDGLGLGAKLGLAEGAGLGLAAGLGDGAGLGLGEGLGLGDGLGDGDGLVTGEASCVGITKSILLVTDGRIGPAFDSTVRARLRLERPRCSTDWIGAVADRR